MSKVLSRGQSVNELYQSMHGSCIGTRYPWLTPVVHFLLPLINLLLSVKFFSFYSVVAYSRFHFTLLQLLNQGDLNERRTWAWVLTPGRAALSDSQSLYSGNRLLMAHNLPEPKWICERQARFFLCSSSLAQKMNAGELLFRLPSDPDKEEAVSVSWVTVPTSLPTANIQMDFSPKWIWCVSFSAWLLRGSFPLKNFHHRLSYLFTWMD